MFVTFKITQSRTEFRKTRLSKLFFLSKPHDLFCGQQKQHNWVLFISLLLTVLFNLSSRFPHFNQDSTTRGTTCLLTWNKTHTSGCWCPGSGQERKCRSLKHPPSFLMSCRSSSEIVAAHLGFHQFLLQQKRGLDLSYL